MSLLRLNARKKRAPVGRPMTDAEKLAAQALGRCSFPPGTAAKRFAHEMAAAADQGLPITEAQSEYLFKLRHRFRRQIPDSVPFANTAPSEPAT